MIGSPVYYAVGPRYPARVPGRLAAPRGRRGTSPTGWRVTDLDRLAARQIDSPLGVLPVHPPILPVCLKFDVRAAVPPICWAPGSAPFPRQFERWSRVWTSAERQMHKPIKYVEKGLTVAAKGAWVVFDALNSIKPAQRLHAEVVRQAAPEVLAEGEAAARLAARDRLALPDLRARGAPGDPRRQARLQDPAQREDRRDQGEHHRARRQDPDGQGLPDARPLRRRHGDGPGVLQAPRGRVPRQRHRARTTTRSCTTTAPARSSTAAARS